MRAIILAAGEGLRLRPYTQDRPKCLVELAGEPLLTHQIAALGAVGIDDVCVVTGYRAKAVAALGFQTRDNPAYAATSMVASLMCAADLLDGGSDVIIAYGDIVYEARVLRALAESPAPISTTVDRSWLKLWRLRMEDPLTDAETLRLCTNGDIIEIGGRPASYAEIEGQYMGLTKVRADFAAELPRLYRDTTADQSRGGRGRADIHMTAFLSKMIERRIPVRAVSVDGGWLEVDSASDLEIYRRLYAEGGLEDYCRLIPKRRVRPCSLR